MAKCNVGTRPIGVEKAVRFRLLGSSGAWSYPRKKSNKDSTLHIAKLSLNSLAFGGILACLTVTIFNLVSCRVNKSESSIFLS